MGEGLMKIPDYNGSPVVAKFNPLLKRWEIETTRKGIPRGVAGKVPLRYCLNWLLNWCKDDDEKGF